MRDAGVRDGRRRARARRRDRRASRPSASCAHAHPDATHGRLPRRRAHAGLRRLAHARRLRPRALRGAGAARRRRADYMEIARRGGGIHSSVRDLRTRSEDELFALAAPRLHAARLVRHHDGRGEVRLRPLARRRAQDAARRSRDSPTRCRCASCRRCSARTRFRSSIASAPNGRREYVDLLVHEMIPAVARGAARALRRRVLRARRLHGRRIARDPHRGARRRTRHQAARRRARRPAAAPSSPASSARRRPIISRRSATPASPRSPPPAPSRRFFPARCSFSARREQAPARRLIDAGVPVALATDFNPGTSPTPNFPLVLTLGVSQLRLSRRRGDHRRDGERCRGARRSRTASDRSRRAFPPIWRCGTSRTFASCRIGTAQPLRGLVDARQTLSPP